MRLVAFWVPVCLLFLAPTPFTGPAPGEQSALDRISAASLKGNLSFLASDALEGRGTPSRGLDIAAEFIAAQFRRAGLEPVAGGDYFQAAKYVEITPTTDSFLLELPDGDKKITVDADHADLQVFRPLELTNAPMYKVESDKLPPLAGKVACLEVPDTRADGGREKYKIYQARLKETQKQQPAAILQFPHGRSRPLPRLSLAEAVASAIPTITVRDPSAIKAFASWKGDATVTLRAKPAAQNPVILRNVAGLLRGSDPELSKTFLLVTAHYDHLGIAAEGTDRIFNGANDDGSGTVSVIEIASALAASNPHPRRSILFITFFGEEKGLFGSRYYAQHPLFPLRDTIADVNLEQLGRTDDNDGPQVGSATFTGYHFSDVPHLFEQAGKPVGVRVYNNEKNGDDFFARSDNQPLADVGIPAHTLAVSFEFPDYHKVSDEWQKIDFDNMAKVDRMVALGLIHIANNAQAPRWNEADEKATPYVKAWHELHP